MLTMKGEKKVVETTLLSTATSIVHALPKQMANTVN